ncbi:MAG: DUF2080 family transposase-associated protein [Nanoarchaeota archaeon]|nr:DUF2080 family transposase-associated protein [Nanoarchaeota archaeon]
MVVGEQIIRYAKVFGNGAHVFVPKEWVGEQITLVRPKKRSLRERILDTLEPYLESITGVYLYGSYARSEQEEDSDVDLLIITNKKVKIREKGFEILSLDKKEIEKAIKLEPLLMYSIFSDCKSIINSGLIEELKSLYTPKLADFSDFLADCERLVKINGEFIESEKEKYFSGDAVIYSLVLRMRGLFILKSLLESKIYTHKSFKHWISKNLPEIDFNSLYLAYKLSKNEKKINFKIKVEDIKQLLEFLKKEINFMKYDKKRKKA